MEQKILNNRDLWSSVNSFLYNHTFSEAFLAKMIEYYDSWVCLKTQSHLTPAFCFTYLYDNDTDSADNWTDFNDLVCYFQKQWPDKTTTEVEQLLQHEHKVALESKKASMTQDRECLKKQDS